MICALCDSKIKGAIHKVVVRGGDGELHQECTCERCWNKHDNVAEAIMAKKKVEKKAAKVSEIRPCAKCGWVDFTTDQARRAHQGKCPGKNPPPKLEKPKPVPIPKNMKAPHIVAPRPPELELTSTREVLQKTIDDGKAEEGKKKRTPSQVGRGSKQKGNKFENEVKKELALWYGESSEVVGSKESKFQRAPGSGGMSPTNWPLDLFVPTDFSWAVECKNREGDAGFDRLERFFTGDKYPLVEWFQTAEEELVTAKVERPLLLVFKKNGFPIMVAFRRPSLPNGDHLMFVTKHMTICSARFGEIVVMELADLFITTLAGWQSVYAAANKASCMPRKW